MNDIVDIITLMSDLSLTELGNKYQLETQVPTF